MIEVKWIKLSTSMFDDEKIKLIEQMPDADTILVIWIKLMAQAGKTNASGYIFLNENIPYTDEMLATIFNRNLSTIRLALKTFKDLGMIEIDSDKFITISNWQKHQSNEAMQKLKKKNEQNRLRQQKYRDKERLETKVKEDSNVTVTLSNASRGREELELDIELDKESNKTVVGKPDRINYSEIVNYLNEKAERNYKTTTKKTQQLIKTRMGEGFTIEDFKVVIDKKVYEWLGNEKWENYLRPETLFGNKFESYLNQSLVKNESDKPDMDDLRKQVQNEQNGQRENAEHIGSNPKQLRGF